MGEKSGANVGRTLKNPGRNLKGGQKAAILALHVEFPTMSAVQIRRELELSGHERIASVETIRNVVRSADAGRGGSERPADTYRWRLRIERDTPGLPPEDASLLAAALGWGAPFDDFDPLELFKAAPWSSPERLWRWFVDGETPAMPSWFRWDAQPIPRLALFWLERWVDDVRLPAIVAELAVRGVGLSLAEIRGIAFESVCRTLREQRRGLALTDWPPPTLEGIVASNVSRDLAVLAPEIGIATRPDATSGSKRRRAST